MRLLAVFASLMQLAIVLLLYFNFPEHDNDWVVPALFSLLTVALINLVVLLFYAANKPLHHPLFGPASKVPERESPKIIYTSPPHPTLIIDDKPYCVLGLSENSVRFSAPHDIQLPESVKIRGRITLLSGRSFAFHGNLTHYSDGQGLIGFTKAVDGAILQAESCVVQPEI